MITRIGAWLRTVALRRRLEREMQEEMALHLSRSTERLVARGLTIDEARDAARREFGNVAWLQEQARDARGSRWLEWTIADVRYGLRHLARTPFSTATMIVLLALAIGFDSATFTLLYSMTNMPPAAVARDRSLVRIRGIDRTVRPGTNPGRELSYPEYRAYAAQTNLFTAVTAWSGTEVLIDVGERTPNLQSGTATYVTANYFRVLGVNLSLGVMPAAPPDEPSPPHLVAVISHALWERYFDLAPDVVGKSVRVNGHVITIVGVAPPRFSGTAMGGSQIRLWLPLGARSVIHRGSPSAFASYDSAFLGVAARLRPGVAAAQALPTVQLIAARTAQLSTTVRPPNALSADIAPVYATNHAPPTDAEPELDSRYILFAMLVIILLIPCTNVSALLVGLAAARRREIAVRLALGAARRRIVRQLLTESVLLALAAGALGLWIIWILLQLFGARIPDLQVALHWPVLAFTVGFALLVGLMFGISPALHATKVGVGEVLKDSGAAVPSSRSRLQSGMVVAQLALAQPLLLALGTLIMDLTSDAERRPAPTFNDRILELRFSAAAPVAPDARRVELMRRLAERFASVPGVVGAVPQQNFDLDMQVAVHPSDRVGGQGYEDRFRIRMQPAPRGYFELFEIPFLRGQGFDATTRDSGAVVIGGDLARRLWGSADPIGRRLVNAGGRGPTALTVVGVVDETRAGLAGNDRRVFVPNITVAGHILVRTRGSAGAMAGALRSIAAAEAPELTLTSARTLAAIEANSRAVVRRAKTAAITTGIIALLISAIGLYAVVAFAVSQRTREIGIRTALGADRGQVVRMFVVRGLRLSIVGMGIGLGLSLIVLRLSAVARGEAVPADTPLLGAIIVSVVIAVAAIATWLPARRAAAVDPLSALRAE